ncbi:hypothetical protein CXB51_006059 [Gossypium anomalum]|uniref:Uncharacterized protein n=1 Tax=Gossypium anomalum TaxID=47600 RepID=A0A8J5ZGB6_9ROSI|nr:hypothetical protein CXB51_006059 [Gossypium anomalum]
MATSFRRLVSSSVPSVSDGSCFKIFFTYYLFHFFPHTSLLSLVLFSSALPDTERNPHSLAPAHMTDLSLSMDWHFLITVRESPMTVTEGIFIAIPSFVACRPTRASVAKGKGTFLCKTVFVAESLPDWPQTTTPDADLRVLLSKAASKVIVTPLGGTQ